jgi:hypothetical protein
MADGASWGGTGAGGTRVELGVQNPGPASANAENTSFLPVLRFPLTREAR